jgi:hypothetical protein
MRLVFLADLLACVLAWRNSLSLPEQVEAMVNYIVGEAPSDATDKIKFVYPYKVTRLAACAL